MKAFVVPGGRGGPGKRRQQTRWSQRLPPARVPYAVLHPPSTPVAARPADAASPRRLLDVVRATPGLTMGELARRVDLGLGTVSYHVQRLQRAGLVQSVASGRRRLVFPTHMVPAGKEPQARALLLGRTCNGIARAVLAQPGCSIAELARVTGAHRRTVYYHVRALRDAGLVRTVSIRRYRGLAAAPRLADLLAPVPP